MTEPPRVWKTDEQVRITVERRTVDGVVVLASPNGKSLMLAFDAMLVGHAGMKPVLWAGMMPVLWDGERYAMIMGGGETVELAPMEGPDAAT